MTAAARTALVTGAARGIGAAAVDELCARGYRVVAVDAVGGSGHGVGGVDYDLAEPAELDAVASRWGDRVVAIKADVRDAEALRAAADTAVESFGGLDAVVAGAAVMAGGGQAWNEHPEIWQTLWDVDVLGVVRTAEATVPHLLTSSTGRFVAIASAAAHRGLYGLSAYCAAKHAVVGFVRGLAADLVGTSATACAVSPGATDTAMLAATARLYGIDDPAGLAAGSLVRRVLTPGELARVIASCCGPEAAAFAGSVVRADGGLA